MRLYYLKNGQKYSAKFSNNDVKFDVRMFNHRTTVRIKALEDITLIKADEVIPFNVNFQDLYFLNGYQSWTDTKEFKLAKRLRNIKKSPHVITVRLSYGIFIERRIAIFVHCKHFCNDVR